VPIAHDGPAVDAYLPIAEHGLIGDLHTVALVGVDGTIDWYCCPRFDAPSVFGAILDKAKGGHYRIAPAGGEWTTKQLYFPDTNVLITRFLTLTASARCRTSCRSRPPGRASTATG
jgi:GH15 family glucan-1,4-alpha-glucosidase